MVYRSSNEFNGTRYDVTFEWVKVTDLCLDAITIWETLFVLELEKEFSYPGHVSAFVTPN